MKFYFFVLFFCLFQTAAHAGVRIVSDFDDTIKRSNIPDGGIRTVRDSVLYKKAYRGIPTLYKAMEKKSNGLYVLSASPKLLRKLIKKTMKTYKIPYKKVFTRRFRELGHKIEYKIDKIESVIDKKHSLILLGDDVEADYEVYKQIDDRNPGKVLDTYIRRVLNRELPEGVIGFYSAFEIAANEYSEGRLSLKDVKQVAEVIQSTEPEEMYRVIPHYAYCPSSKEAFTPVFNTELKVMEQQVLSKIMEFCNLRKKSETVVLEE